MASRGRRDEMVIATKYTTDLRMGSMGGIKSNFTGNNTKSLHMSVEASLKKLQTDYIDVVSFACRTSSILVWLMIA